MFLLSVFEKVSAYLRYRANVRELSQLSDRELADIGVARFEIEMRAREAAIA